MKLLDLVIDDHSRFPEIEVVHSTSAKAVILKLDRIFAAYGVRRVVKSDNGPPFNGGESAQFTKYVGFKHRKVSSLWPEANGEVECFMKTFGKVLRTTANWKQEMYQFLRNYRATPHCVLQVLPLLQPCLGGQLESSYPALLLCQVVKVMTL